MDHTLFTYRNLEELRKIQEEREVFAFIFGETKDMLDSCSEVCIDISALVHFLITNKNNIEPTYINFTSMAEDTVVIAEVAIAESAMELLPLLFSDYKCYFEEAFLELLLEMAKTKYSEQFAEIEMTEDEKKQLYAFDYSSLSALRDIKRVFNNRLMDYFAEKGVLR